MRSLPVVLPPPFLLLRGGFWISLFPFSVCFIDVLSIFSLVFKLVSFFIFFIFVGHTYSGCWDESRSLKYNTLNVDCQEPL